MLSSCRVGGGCLLFLLVSGCVTPGERAKLIKENVSLRNDNERLQRVVAQRDGTIAQLHEQIRNLKDFEPGRPADLFAPVSLEIASLSGGADYDGKPGDDGVTVHLRPRDADGDTVKAPGRITIQLLDNSDLASPRVLGVYVFDDPEKLRNLWHGRFATDHYTLRCPFAPGTRFPESRRLTISAEFIDYLTGRTLSAVKEIRLSQVTE